MMKINSKPVQRAITLTVLIALIAGSVVPSFGHVQRRRARRTVTRTVIRASTPVIRRFTIPADTTMRVRMNEKISSGAVRVNDRFTTTVVDPVYVSGVEVVPAGSIVNGRVTSVEKAGRKSKAGAMGVGFVSIQTPHGATYPINGSLINVSGSTEEYDDEGQVTGRSATRRNAVFIGGGAATGAVIGAIAGGGKGAGVGAGVGAGLGIAGALLSRGKEAVVEPGTEFGVILNRGVTLPASNVR
ncbi:MAG: hypothetical protein H0W76_07495 [Pyrinomonadaceae bacterium]|nr:hypothetical protein [Pyrinomonadaceae bacterium]